LIPQFLEPGVIECLTGREPVLRMMLEQFGDNIDCFGAKLIFRH
jgi:hypothetical protein